MRSRLLIALMVSTCLALGGCSVSREVENQAYALVFGVDLSGEGGIELTIRAPTIGRSSGEESGASQSSPYHVFSARGRSYADALRRLEETVPRDLNLSHIKLLVASEEIARSGDFASLISRIAETPHLYTTTRFVICEGSANEFIRAQKTIIGTRLSAEIDAMFEHYASCGAIPDSCFSEVYYASRSIYSDPVAAWGWLSEPGSGGGAASETTKAPMEECYSGAVVFRDGVMACRLDTGQTRLLNLLLGIRESFQMEHAGKPLTFTPDGSPAKRVEISGNAVHVEIDIRLSTIDSLAPAAVSEIESEVARSLAELVRACQALHLEPFGLAEAAAGGFLTVPEWMAFDWRERFSQADVDIRVHLRGASDR